MCHLRCYLIRSLVKTICADIYHLCVHTYAQMHKFLHVHTFIHTHMQACMFSHLQINVKIHKSMYIIDWKYLLYLQMLIINAHLYERMLSN